MNRNNIILLLVIILAFSLRYFQLATYPATLYGDEQAFAWNAYNILKTGADEYGTKIPLEFRSFDDYKSPLPVYLLVPLFKFLGMNAYSIRLPVVIFSTATVPVFYFLVKIFLKRKTALIAVFLTAVSSWHIHLSRGYFEATISLFFMIAGFYYLVRRENSKSIILSAGFLALSAYSYFTPRILLPVLLPLTAVYLNYYKKGSWKKTVRVFLLTALMVSPLVISVFSGYGLSRFQKLSVGFSQSVAESVKKERRTSLLPDFIKPVLHNKYQTRIKMTLDYYLEQLSPNFLFIYGDNSLRYFLGGRGMLYLWEYPFLIAGLYYLFRQKRFVFWFFLIWLLLAPLPASLVGKPFAVRSITMLPPLYVFIAAGIHFFFRRFAKISLTGTMVLSFTAALFMVFYLMRYYLEYPVYAATWWGWENKAALDYAAAKQEDYERIFISDFYSGSALAYAVYNSVDPDSYRLAKAEPVTLSDGRHFLKIGKYYFGSLDLNNKRLEEKVIPDKSLYIGRPEEPAGEDEILASDDGRLIFVVHDTLKKDCYIEKRKAC